MSSTRTSHGDHIVDWCIWKVFVPFLAVAILWPTYWLIWGIRDPFTKAFEHGDLLIFAALLFVEAAIETNEARKQDSPISKWIVEIAKVAAMFMMVAFAAIKIQIVMSADKPDESKLLAYATFSVSAAILAIVVAMWSLYKVGSLSASAELESVGVDDK